MQYDAPMADQRRRHVRYLVATVVGGAVAAIPMAIAWVQLADPPAVRVTDRGAFLGEAELGRLVNQPAWLIVVGLVGGLVLGFVAAALAPRHPATALAGVLLASTIAIVLTGWLGHHVVGPDRDQQIAAAQVGDVVRAEVSAGTWVAYLSGPVGGLGGGLLAIAALWPKAKVASPWQESESIVPEATSGSSTV